ncbi:MAG: hypothetical protein ACFB9M_02190 [Myxococcota bacterium]
MRFELKNTLKLLPAILLVGAVACGDDEDDDGTTPDPDMGMPAPDMGGMPDPDMGMPPTGLMPIPDPPTVDDFPAPGDADFVSFQDSAVVAGAVITQDASPTLDADTLAVTLEGDVTPEFDIPAGFEATDYFGAVDPDGTPFWDGWTVINSGIEGGLPGDDFHPLEAEITAGDLAPSATNECENAFADFGFVAGGFVDVFGVSFPVCVIPGGAANAITEDLTLVNNHVFVLNGNVTIGSGAAQGAFEPDSTPTLTVPAGTQIYAGVQDAVTGAALVITRGAQILVQGTAALPVVMGAVSADFSAEDVVLDDPTDLTDRGEWGGLVLSGLGPTNQGETQTEAAPAEGPEIRFFGGEVEDDSSGDIDYLIVAETGFAFQPDAEVQGITCEAPGSGTTLDFIQVIQSDDDCIEFFGGSASVDNIVCNGVTDDGLDIDLGYQGDIQFALVRMSANFGNHGIESDNNGDNFLATPFSAPDIVNFSALGNAAGDSTGRGALHQEGFAGRIFRSVFIDDTAAGGAFEDGCLDVVDENTVHSTGETLQHVESVFDCSGDEPPGSGLSSPND